MWSIGRRAFPVAVLLLVILSASGCRRPEGRKRIVLEVVRAFDPRLAILSDEDMRAVLEEGRNVIAAKLAGDITLEFRDNGKMSAGDLFLDTAYSDSDFYRTIGPYKYDMALGKDNPLFQSVGYRRSLVGFLRSWSIPSLKGFYPKERVGNYEQAAAATLRVYHDRIAWLRTLKAPDGSLLVADPAVSYQSYTEWLGMMHAQKRFDVVFTNTLIVLDTANNPYPHSITKHAKVGGSSFDSPARGAMGGRSVMVNIIEDFGGVPGISRERKVSRDRRNKLVGAVLFAHEFAHAFYLIPDVYDHPLSCLMNTNMENLDMEKAYDLLWTDRKPCPLCRPYVESKSLEIRGRAALANRDYAQAGALCYSAAAKLPEKLDMDRQARLTHLYTCARDGFSKAGQADRVAELDRLLKQTGR